MSYLENIFNLQGKIAVVTGGTGILGTEYTKALVSAGAKVAVFDIKDEPSDDLWRELFDQKLVKYFKVDITKRDSVEEGLKLLSAQWGTPNILINNAALDFPPSKEKETFEDYPIEKWNSVLNVNLTGMLICCQVIGGAMAEAGRGSIINISSIYGLLSPDQRIYDGFIKPVSYSVTKSGVFNLSRYLSTYWGDKGVRVNTLTLGGVFNNQNENFVQKYSQKTPLGRMANRSEYVGPILFLASDASSYMTGSNMIVDGGWSAW